MIFRTAASNKNFPKTIVLDSLEVEVSNTSKFLGIHINQNLDWSHHISELRRGSGNKGPNFEISKKSYSPVIESKSYRIL
ncbi:unnamed protein product [Callosobruchus maculatus]|uniref:Uncharacterized protein n=1 Tax=Callosobruchus maculatus TaxID=64391 RepID=A0A653CCN0_CALMS|nr:unnamed protein product [Callosobruchus maculatus]